MNLDDINHQSARRQARSEAWLEYMAKLQDALPSVVAAAEKRQAERKQDRERNE